VPGVEAAISMVRVGEADPTAVGSAVLSAAGDLARALR